MNAHTIASKGSRISSSARTAIRWLLNTDAFLFFAGFDGLPLAQSLHLQATPQCMSETVACFARASTTDSSRWIQPELVVRVPPFDFDE